MLYTAKSIHVAPTWNCRWEDWADAETATLSHARPEGSDHVPHVQVRLMHDDDTLYGIIQCDDQYVKSVHVGYQVDTCFDSCVEFFFKPTVGPGYFNLEMNAGGSFLFYYVRDWTPAPVGDAYVDYEVIPEKHGRLVTVKTTMPQIVEPEIETPLTWRAQFAIPRAAFEPYCGSVGELSGQCWTCNFYKCGDETSHPHWLSWSPVPELNFHAPEAFGKLQLT